VPPLKVLVTDPIMSRFDAELRRTGQAHEWTIAAGWDPDRLLAAVRETDVLVCSSMTEELAAAAARLRLVHTTGAGFDKIPLASLAGGVRVANTFHHARPIAEHVAMVALMLSRRVLSVDRELRSGTWRTVANDPEVPFHSSFDGRTVGILGFGSIGTEVARVLGGLGMRVRAVRRNPGGAVPEDVTVDWVGGIDDLRDLLAASDVVVVTLPLSDETRGLIDAEALGAMRPDAILVNVARGPIIDETALADALAAGTIGGAALDVWWGAPDGQGNAPASVRAFAAFDNVVLTPHYSGHALSTFELRAADIADNVNRLASGLPLFNVVHPGATRL
jgi:phosphoglycerate dehydrogenase-like enzyme